MVHEDIEEPIGETVQKRPVNSSETMVDGDPQEPLEYETVQKIAVNGDVVAELRRKPEALISDLEDEAMFVILAAAFADMAQDDEARTELLREYDPKFRLQLPAEDGENKELRWTPANRISETGLLGRYEDLYEL